MPGPEETQPWPAPEARTVAGRYHLLREIGRGGMGSVWLARDALLHRTVAIKRIGLFPGGASPDLQRAEREARLAAMLNHPHVVAVFDLITDSGQQWLVMEYVEGRTLAGLVTAEGPLSTQRLRPILLQAAEALVAAHAAGIVHRDVKPSNILLSTDGQVKLTDFGIARATADATLTQTGMVTGSPAYLAPEVATGATATAESDVWSLGATAFHALSGRPPYDATENVLGALFKIVHEEPPRLPDAGDLAPLLEATMAKQPSARWSMREVRDYLARGPGGSPLRGPAARLEEPTAVLPAVPAGMEPPTRAAAPNPVTARTSAPTPAAAPVAAPPPRTEVTAPANRRSAPMMLLAVAVLVLLAALGWQLLGSGDTADPPAADPTSSAPAEPTPTAEDTEGPTTESMEQFITDYLATVTTDPGAAWQMLTPDFQRESGNYGQYSRFWGGFESARPTQIEADPETLQISYLAHYVLTDGQRMTDRVELTLEYDDGQFRIADERDA